MWHKAACWSLKLIWCFQGYCRAGEVSHHHNSLLQRSHGKSALHPPCPPPEFISYITWSWDLVCEDDCFSSQGIMLVYDISNEKSFENIKNWIRNIEEVSSEMKLKYIHKMNLFMVEHAVWQRYCVLRHNESLNFSQHASSDVEKMILGNKCDMTDRRQVSKDRGEKVSLCSRSLLISHLKHIEILCTFPKCVAWHSLCILILLSWQLIMELSSWKPVQSRAWM